jgi:hypothetical protein
VVTYGKCGHAVAKRVDDSGSFMPHNQRQWNAPFSSNYMEVGVAHPGSTDTYANFPGLGLGKIYLVNGHVGSIECDCLHEATPLSVFPAVHSSRAVHHIVACFIRLNNHVTKYIFCPKKRVKVPRMV